MKHLIGDDQRLGLELPQSKSRRGRMCVLVTLSAKTPAANALPLTNDATSRVFRSEENVPLSEDVETY